MRRRYKYLILTANEATDFYYKSKISLFWADGRLRDKYIIRRIY